MTFHRRIRTIYAKELIDILRDRRTLIAMIVVPLVLYPLLMLGSIQAVSYQVDSLDAEKLFIGVTSEADGRYLHGLIDQDRELIERRREGLDPESEEYVALPTPIEDVDIRAFVEPTQAGSVERIRQLIRERRIQVGVVVAHKGDRNDPAAQVKVELFADLEEIRGRSAYERLRSLFRRTGDREATTKLERVGLPAEFMRPFVLSVEDLSAPQSVLGQILPLILILMTITGAIYPAIDLTAGERERGTLESLMVCPVPVIDLIVGKFLVVTTVAIMGATLNLASVSATVYFGGFDKVIASTGGAVPYGKMIMILLCLVPFAVLMSAIMIAVCSFARTFKEAQNYVTPVILAVLIPGGIAALPTTKFDGLMLAMPVANMVLLARELLLGAAVPFGHTAVVLISTTLYAAAAVAVAANVFGRESVVFADSGSFKALLSRKNFRPQSGPPVSLALLVVALLFPVWFYVQAMLSPGPDEPATGLLFATAWLMPLLFVAIPVALLVFAKVSVAETLRLKLPAPRYLLAGVLVGLAAWVPAHELNVAQIAWLGVPKALEASVTALTDTLRELPIGSVFLFIAVVPALCEELLFRGLLLSGLARGSRKWPAIVISAVVFGVFHFFIFKFPVTAALGVVLAYLCWQSRSILPGVIVHLLHNGLGVLSVKKPEWFELIGVAQEAEESTAHLPTHIIVIGCVAFVAGLALCRRSSAAQPSPNAAPIAVTD